jgi:hypothetical protein
MRGIVRVSGSSTSDSPQQPSTSVYSSGRITVTIYRSVWEANHAMPWDQFCETLRRLSGFPAALRAVDAGWVTYSHAFYDIVCADLIVEKSGGTRQELP